MPGTRGRFKPPTKPPFQVLTAILRDPEKVKLAYTPDSIWRNRDTFLTGRDEIAAFLRDKWSKENGYRLRKELFAFTENKASPVLRPSPMPRETQGWNQTSNRVTSRSRFNSGMNGMTRTGSGGGLMAWRIGRLRTMVS
jgi:hypothetical protein